MKKILLAAIFPFLLIACAKEEVTNPSFRSPTCVDTTDEGIFENFTMPETVEFLRFFTVIPDSAYYRGLDSVFINGRVLYNRGIDYNPYIGFKCDTAARIFAFVPFSNQPEQYYSWVIDAWDTSQTYQVNLYHLRQQDPQLQAGCYRVYYVVSSSDTGFVYNKGHYDFEIKNQ